MGYPAAHAVVAATPIEVRATVLGLINAAAGIGAMLANIGVPALLSRQPWEVPFMLLGVLGLGVAASLVLLAARARVGLRTRNTPRPLGDPSPCRRMQHACVAPCMHHARV